MTLGELIDAAGQMAEECGIELNRVEWTHSRSFDNLRIGGRRLGDVGQGRIAVLTKMDGHPWTEAQAREAIAELEALIASG
jgi:hypothetical protein